MAKIIGKKKLELREAISKAVLKIHAGYCGFFVDTEFGLVGIEVRRHQEGPMRWYESPATKFTMDNRMVKANYYISIKYNEYQREELTTFFLTGFMCECYLMELFKTIDQSQSFRHSVMLDAVSYMALSNSELSGFMSIYENSYRLAKLLGESEFPTPIMRRGRVYESWLNQGSELYGKRVMAAKDYVREAVRDYKMEQFWSCDFGYDPFYEFIIGMLMKEVSGRYTQYINRESLKTLLSSAEYDMTPHEAIVKLLKKAVKKSSKPDKEV